MHSLMATKKMTVTVSYKKKKLNANLFAIISETGKGSTNR